MMMMVMMMMMMMMMVKVMMMMIVPAALRRSCNAWHQIVLQSFWVFTNALPRIGRHFWGHLPLRWMHRLMIGFTLHFNLFSNDECSLYVSHLLLVGSFGCRGGHSNEPQTCVCVCVCVRVRACVRAYVCVCDYVYTCACISSSCVSFISSFFLFPSHVCTAIKSSYLHLSLCSSTLSGHPSSSHSKRTHTYLPTSCQRNQQHSRKHCGSLMIKLQTCAYFLRIPLVNKHCNGILSCNMSHVFSGLTLTTPLATQQIGHLLIL